jgi:hypothetical protein
MRLQQAPTLDTRQRKDSLPAERLYRRLHSDVELKAQGYSVKMKTGSRDSVVYLKIQSE